MLVLEYESIATFFTSGAALFILAGMLANTTLYRRRGRPEDRLFFALIITDMVAAFFDSASMLLFETGVALSLVVYTFIFTALFSVYVVFGALWCMYLMFRLEQDQAKVRKKLPWIFIPAAAVVLFYLSGMFTGFMLWEGIELGKLHISPFTVSNLAPILIYGIITLAMTFGRNKRICILYGVLILVNTFFLMALDVVITPLILSIYLIYAHLFAIRDPFYGEVTEL